MKALGARRIFSGLVQNNGLLIACTDGVRVSRYQGATGRWQITFLQELPTVPVVVASCYMAAGNFAYETISVINRQVQNVDTYGSNGVLGDYGWCFTAMC